jgi:hypothetical protein
MISCPRSGNSSTWYKDSDLLLPLSFVLLVKFSENSLNFLLLKFIPTLLSLLNYIQSTNTTMKILSSALIQSAAENLTRRTNERGRSKSESLYQVDEFPLREDVFARKSYDGYLLGNPRRNSTRRISLNLPRILSVNGSCGN